MNKQRRFDVTAPRGKQRTAIVHVTYRFEAPDAGRSARGARNNGTATVYTKAEDVSDLLSQQEAMETGKVALLVAAEGDEFIE